MDYTLVYTDNTAILNLGVNYLSPGIQPLTWKGSGAFAGTITGWAGQIFGDLNGINNPGFVDPLNFDFRLAFNSACINKGQAQHPLVTPAYAPLFEFLPPMTAIARPVLGGAIDLGAHEDSGLSQVTPLLSIGNATLAEGNSGTKLMSFLVALSTPAPAPITVNYTTVNGTAIAGSDYVKTQGALLIPAGASTAVINVPIIGDATVESDESFTVVLSNAVNAQLINSIGTGTIQNDDGVQGGIPAITSFTPGSGPVGTLVTLTGKNFTGATQVALHDLVALSFTIVNSTTIKVIVPPGAISGRWRVSTPAGKGFAATDFVVTP